MLELEFGELDDELHDPIWRIILNGFQFLSDYKNRTKAFAEGMFGYVHFNLNLEAFVNNLDEYLQEHLSKFDYARLLETNRSLSSHNTFQFEPEGLNISLTEDSYLIDFLFRNYQFLNSYLETLQSFGEDIFSEVAYNNRLQQYVEDYKVFLENQFGPELFETMISDFEGFTLTNGEYYNNDENVE